MSAFIVESETLDKIITAIVHDRDGDFWRRKLLKDFGFDLSAKTKPVIFVVDANHFSPAGQAFGLELCRLNYAAVNQRYGGIRKYPAIFRGVQVQDCSGFKDSSLQSLAVFVVPMFRAERAGFAVVYL